MIQNDASNEYRVAELTKLMTSLNAGVFFDYIFPLCDETVPTDCFVVSLQILVNYLPI